MNAEERSSKLDQLAARFKVDAVFKRELLADPVSTLKRVGFEIPSHMEVRAVADAAGELQLMTRSATGELSDDDLNTLAGEYAEDAMLASPGDPVATNDVDRRKALQGLVGDPNFKLNFASDRVLVSSSGDLATSRGHYTITTTDKATNKPTTSDGTYLTVYKKQGDGGWKAVEDVIIPGPAKAAAK
jgi:ketosteroid isomerase-like protein